MYVTGQAVASGDGGQGKTVLAQAYAHQYASDYPGGRFVVSCESIPLLTRLAALLPPSEQTKGQTDEQRAALVRGWLTRNERSLLILDNVTDDSQWCQPEFRALLPGKPCHVIVTTRAERLSGIDAVPVARLTEEEAFDLLDKFRPTAKDPSHRAAIRTILVEIESLAATVAAVGAVMQLDEYDDWEAYATHLSTATVDGLPDHTEAVRRETGYTGKTAVVLDDLRKRLPPAELRALDYAALLPADGIVPLWLETLLNTDADAARSASRLDLGQKPSGKPRSAADVLNHLRKLDLLRPSAGSDVLLSLHRLHRRRASELLAAQPPQRNALLDAITELAEARGIASYNAVLQPALRTELAPLAALVFTLVEAQRPDAAASLANWVQQPLSELARYAEAKAVLTHVLNNDDSSEQATAHNNLALILHDLGDLAAARIHMERAIAIGEKHFDPDHPTLATRYSNLATILQAVGDLPAARTHMERAIAIEQKHFDPGHPTLATSYNNIAWIDADAGEFDRALEWETRALSIVRKHFNESHPSVQAISRTHAVFARLASLPPAEARALFAKMTGNAG
ncbi:MAG TPA: tetratricopeptide repeat protein [Tepidisphaeraceae bacterium]|nr:tetratricopeptide repeat protein [Tepidisphaeraceae bacterium]